MLKLRPGTHFSPLPTGVLVAGRGERFVLQGPRGLYDLLDGQLGRLLDGTEAAALAQAVGDVRAESVFAHLLHTLLARDVLFDPSTHPAPDDDESVQFARTISYCEATCAEPYAAFARLRAARVAIVAGCAVPESLVRSLTSAGIRTTHVAVADAVVVVRDLDAPGPDVASGAPVLPVWTGRDVAVVGPWSAAGADTTWTQALGERADAWAAVDPAHRAPRTTAAALAGSLAARSVLDRLLGTDAGERNAVVVHGARLRTTTVPAPADDGDDSALTAALRGPLRRGTDEDLPQLPMSVATARVVTAPGGPLVHGWGTDRAAAHREVLLAGVRLIGADGRGVVGAGTSAARAELDGRLQQLATTTTADEPVTWEQVDASRPRALWSLLEDHYGRRLDVAVHRSPDGWTLAAATDADGSVHRQWGSSVEAAVFAALGALTVAVQLGPDAPAAPATAGTQDIARVGDGAVTHALAWTGRLARWHYEPLDPDAVIGTLPLHAGAVWSA